MTWTEENKPKAIELILDCIADGQSLKSIIDGRSREEVPAYSTFMVWLSEDKELAEKYTRACEERADLIFEDIIQIADDSGTDLSVSEQGFLQVNGEAINRSRLRIDARKWALSKMNPKKYGDKVDVTTKGETLNNFSIKDVLTFKDPA